MKRLEWGGNGESDFDVSFASFHLTFFLWSRERERDDPSLSSLRTK